MLRSALDRWNRGEYAHYLVAMEQASQLDPDNHHILIDMGAAHGMLYDYGAAKKMFERAFVLAPDKSEAMAMAGLKCRNFNRFEMAEVYFERAVREKGANPDTFAKLAEMYERLRKTDSAGEMVQAALQLDPSNALALLVRARLYRTADRLADAERVVRSFLGWSDNHSWSTRIRGWYELGAILDRMGRYDEAMAAFLQAKAMIMPNAGGYREAQLAVHGQYKLAMASSARELFRNWQEEGRSKNEEMHRFAVIAGHPRSGTTLLEQLLDSHPQVVSAEETPIFYQAYVRARALGDTRLPMIAAMEKMPPNVLEETRNQYFANTQKFIGEPIGNRLLIDKNPSLTGLAHGLLRIIPGTKFVIALRDPRDVCLSCFMQPLPLNQVSSFYLSLADVVTEYVALMGFWRWIAEQIDGDMYLHVRYEDIVSDVGPVIRKTLGFLGLSWDQRVLRFDEFAKAKLVRSPTYAEVSKPISSTAVGRWRNYEKYLMPHIEKLRPFMDAFGYAG